MNSFYLNYNFRYTALTALGKRFFILATFFYVF